MTQLYNNYTKIYNNFKHNKFNLTFNQDWSIHIIFTISTFNIQRTNCTQNEVGN